LPVSKQRDENLKLYKQLTRTQIAPESADNERFKNRRLLALYFDMSAMNPADQLRALSAAEQFIRTQMTTVDLVSILRYQGGSVDVLQDFTADRDRLLSILNTLIVAKDRAPPRPWTTRAALTRAPHSARTTASLMCSTPIASSPHWRLLQKCLPIE